MNLRPTLLALLIALAATNGCSVSRTHDGFVFNIGPQRTAPQPPPPPATPARPQPAPATTTPKPAAPTPTSPATTNNVVTAPHPPPPPATPPPAPPPPPPAPKPKPAEPPFVDDGATPRWDLARLSQPPAMERADGFDNDGVQAIFYEGLPWKGRRTRIFAYLGIPEHPPGAKLPAMVLVHGGGGTAFPEWVRYWNDHGYVAIAMDTNGKNPKGWHDFGGPPGWGSFDQIHLPLEDQWTYHAVGAILLANSLLQSLPDVNPDRIGLCGISWGGYLACLAASVDDRFRFAAPIYGCGFLAENSAWSNLLANLPAAKRDRWIRCWEPKNYLPRTKTPFYWLTSPNDKHYPLDSWQKSYRLAPTPRTLWLRIGLGHSHYWGPRELIVYANHHLKDGPPLARVTRIGDGWVEYQSEIPVTSATLCFTTDTGPWPQRRWQRQPATVDKEKSRAFATLPPATTAYYFDLHDSRGLDVSSDHVEVPAPASANQPDHQPRQQ